MHEKRPWRGKFILDQDTIIIENDFFNCPPQYFIWMQLSIEWK